MSFSNKYHLSILLIIVLISSCATQKQVVVQKFGNHKKFISPPLIKKGDTVMYIAPAGEVDSTKHYMPRADSLMKSWGFVVKYPKNLYKKHFTFGGTDSQRLQDLQQAFDDPTIKVIWCARGGYGTVRIIDNINFEKFKKHPKWVIGYSDITVLHSLLHREGYQSVHAFMPISLAHHRPNRKLAIQSLKDFFENKRLSYTIPSDSLNISGKGKGVVVGGNLSLIVSLLGSKYQINTDGKILFLEDVGEYTYSYDKMIYALKNAGYFDHLQGLIIGGTGVKKDDDFIGETVKQIILKHVKNKGYPVIFNFPAGHVVDNRTLIFGREAKIKVNSKTSTLKY